ncbi:MAG: biopolymer transporter ExbD [Ferruginibacter sp.]
MAEINQPNQKNKKGRAFFSKKNVRVDLTPMVDLGFILVTFFVFTTTLSESMAMDMVTPKDGADSDICESCALTFIPVKGDSIWYYEGMEEKADYRLITMKEVRSIISRKKAAVIAVRGNDQLQVILKGAESSEFKDMIDLIDECNINMVKRYFMDELSTEQKQRFN